MTPVDLIDLVIFFIGGLAIGSFINAAEYRVARQMSFVVGPDGRMARSICPQCGEALLGRDLIPVVSFIALGGKCRFCGEKISVQYPVVELTVALACAFVAFRYGMTLEAVAVALFTGFLAFIFIYDLKHQLIPDGATIPGMVVAAAGSYVLGLSLIDIALGAVIGGGFFLAQYVVSRGGWIGGGDIRLGLLMGLMLGWQRTIVALFLAYVVGAVVALALLVSGRAGRKTRIPFGTFLAAGTFVALLYGREIIDWYLSFIL